MIEGHVQDKFTVNVWGGIIEDTVIGPYFIEGTQTGEKYANFINNDLPALLYSVNTNWKNQLWFMQDGHPAHTSHLGLAAIKNQFGNKLISNKTTYEWPPRSPDLTPCDFFLWGYIKEVSIYEKF